MKIKKNEFETDDTLCSFGLYCMFRSDSGRNNVLYTYTSTLKITRENG